MDSEQKQVYGGAIQGSSLRGLVGAQAIVTPTKIGEINNQLSILSGSSERLLKAVSILENKLEMVLHQIPENEAKDEELTPTTQIASIIFDSRSRVDIAINCIDSIIRRLEL